MDGLGGGWALVFWCERLVDIGDGVRELSDDLIKFGSDKIARPPVRVPKVLVQRLQGALQGRYRHLLGGTPASFQQGPVERGRGWVFPLQLAFLPFDAPSSVPT